MNSRLILYILSVAFCFLNTISKAQHQFSDFSKEKTYIQTDHVYYKPGEGMYYKIYVVNAGDNLPTHQSKVVNMEIAEPSGAIVKKEKIEIKNGYAEGFFYFDHDMKGGIYRLKAYTHWMLNETGKNAFEKEITLQKIVSPRILMKLDFPKKGYGAGDEVMADFSMKSLANLPIPFYEAEYTVMHHGEKVSEGKLITDKEGKYLLKFRLPEILKSSDALLTVKVEFDGFTESISRNIPIVLNDLDIKFMPEGGTFINGIEQNIAFKILDEFEKPVDATLAIYNQKNEKITEVPAYHFGMGSFYLTPKNDEKYYAKVLKPENITQIYQLPAAKNDGIIFNLKKESQNISLLINSTSERNVVILGNFRKKEVYSKSLTLKKGLNQVEISEKEFPIGICRFTVFENNIPLAERIVFTNEDRQLNIKISPVKQNALPREKMVLNIETRDENQNPVSANLGISVMDDKLWTYADDKQNHVISWLLMDSELRGKIERPQFYFDKTEKKSKKTLDLVMLTNGYRYFELIPEVIKNKKYKHLPEKKNPIYGIVEDEDKKPVKAEVYLVQNNEKILSQITSEDGLFYFTDLSRAGQTRLIAKSLQPKQKVKIRLLAYKLNINPLEKQKLENIDVDEIIKEAEIKEKTQQQATEGIEKIVRNKPSVNSQTDTIASEKNIEEVVYIGYASKREMTGAVTTVKSNLVQNANVSSVLAGQVAGVMVNSTPGNSNSNVVIRGYSSISNAAPLYIIDGAIAGEKELKAMNTNNINDISVLKDAAATSLYGNRGSNGVIIINTTKNRNTRIKFDLTAESYYEMMMIPNDSLDAFSYSRAFSYPVYKTTNTAYRHDYRETIYWNPVVETDKNGKAQIEFFNSDANTTFRVIAEGISSKGLVGRKETTYAAQSLISMDAKIPQYLTRTDTMLIPVVIKNNSSETRKMTMDVMVPNHVRLVKYDSILTLKPLESGRLYAEIQTDKIIGSNIQFSIRSGDFRETMILPFKVDEKGFPHHYSIINNKTENFKVDLPEIIDGSLYSSYYIYENSALQMFEDLERLKKEPHGCFEQLSSTVYPNIFILDYLKSTKKIDTNTESNVIRNMKKGFQKMLSYKNRDGGFGYFSSSESDVALSAFALLEFRDLKKYVDIDPKIIQQLSTFILSKKEGNGLFQVRRYYENTKGFSDYAWSRNMYVLYALSKVGYTTEIQDSYKVSLARAVAMKDSYQLALMANVAAHLDQKEDYKKLLTMLNLQFKDQAVNTKITFTGSGGMSANAETLSLYLMALQKNREAQILPIAEVADELINYNGYYGFGSTQATSLALEALSDFFGRNTMMYGTEKPSIKVNDLYVNSNLSLSSAYHKGENEMQVFYPSGKGLPYKIDYGYYTLQAPKSENIPVILETKLKDKTSKVGQSNRMTVTVKNTVNGPLPMTTAKIGIPAGLTLQNALLKDMVDKKQVSYYEIFDNYLVLYWEHLDANETKTVNLDLKVEFAGQYTGKASNVYLYYMPESKFWNEGIKAEILP